MTLSIRLYLAGQILTNVSLDVDLLDQREQMGRLASAVLSLADAVCEAAGMDGRMEAFPAPSGVQILTSGGQGAALSNVLPTPLAPKEEKEMVVKVKIQGLAYSSLSIRQGATEDEIRAAICTKHPMFAQENRRRSINWVWTPEDSVMSIVWGDT